MTPDHAPGHSHDHSSAAADGTTRPRKQEQEEATTEIHEVAPGILRMQLPISLPGLGHVNTYALEDGDGFTLVDPGLPGEASWKALHVPHGQRRHPPEPGAPRDRDPLPPGPLRRRGHAGRRRAAPRSWRRATSGWAAIRRTTAASASSRRGPARRPRRRSCPRTSPCRRPGVGDGGRLVGDERKVVMERRREMFAFFRRPDPTVHVDDSDRLALGNREWMGVYTPGHTNDHLCLFDPEGGVLLSGDHVLPTITPHISGLIEGDPLRAYLDSLDRVAAFEGVTDRPAGPRPPVHRPARSRRRHQGAPRRAARSRCASPRTTRAGPRCNDLMRTAVQGALVGPHGRERDLRPPRAPAPARRGRPPRRSGPRPLPRPG